MYVSDWIALRWQIDELKALRAHHQERIRELDEQIELRQARRNEWVLIDDGGLRTLVRRERS